MFFRIEIVLLFLFPLFCFGYNYFTNVQGECRGKCETNMTFPSEGGSDLFCDKQCSVVQCNKGCSLYQSAVHSGCPKVCTSSHQRNVNSSDSTTPGQDEMRNCIQGCIFALNSYAQGLEDKIGHLDKPVIVRESIGYSELTLKWSTPILGNVTYKVHKRLTDIDSGWHLHNETTFSRSGTIRLQGLHPYATYKFKVLMLLSSLPTHILTSPETVEITTLAHGAPSTTPRITSITTPSPTAISLSWQPPPFTNGKLLSYRIYVQPVDNKVINGTTIEVSYNATSWLLSQLKSSQEYVISVSAWNNQGEGPKTNKRIKTPNPGNPSSFHVLVSANETPYLLSIAGGKIVMRNLLDALEYYSAYSTSLYSSRNSSVRDFSLHIKRRLILTTDSLGQVTCIYLAHTGSSLIISQTVANYYPTIPDAGAISVDWLNDKVYIAGMDKIYGCPLEGHRGMVASCIVVVRNLDRPVSDIKVDPINGYLFYVINGPKHGLYRIDLYDIARLNASPMETRFSSANTAGVEPGSFQAAPTRLAIAMNHLQTFVIDFNNVHVYVVDNSNRTMMAAFLDGTNMRPFHKNIASSAFINVRSAVFYQEDSIFIWTDSQELYREAYDSRKNIYNHNELLYFSGPYGALNIFHHTSQPTPVPSTAPANLQVLFTRTKARITWELPSQLQYQGRGAWQTDSYQLQVISEDGLIQTYNKSGLILSIKNLTPNSKYIVKVRARSTSGYGPWSEEFIGRTSKEDGLRVLMGIAGGSIVEQVVGDDNHSILVNFYSDASDIAWHEDTVLWTTLMGSLFVYNTTSRRKRVLVSLDAKCLTYDWLGHKVYWSEPKNEVIRRSDINGINSEYIHKASARDIAIDAVGGRLYWATEHSIMTSYLNGDEQQELYSIPYFSGQQVISLTLDLQSSKLFWYVKGFNKQSLYKTDLIQAHHKSPYKPVWQEVGDLTNIASYSGLHYFSQKMFWLTEKNSLVVGNMNGNYISSVSDFSNVTAFTLKHPQLHLSPENKGQKTVRVIPNQIRSTDIRTVGDWSNFNLTWPESSEVTHGTVYFKVIVEIGVNKNQFTSSRYGYPISGLSPYTLLVVSIQPYTYWAYAEPTTVSLRSPMSIPTAPQSPEVYVKQYKNDTASQKPFAADFRWNSPHLTNGIISYHEVTYWKGDHIDQKVTIRVSGTERHFILTHLAKSESYHFKVRACTVAGCGEDSIIKTAITDSLNPIPTLLVASKQGLVLAEVDSHLNTSQVMAGGHPEVVTFLSHDGPLYFWMDQRRSILYQTSENKSSKLMKLENTGKDIAIDWISRSLYIVETLGVRESKIMEYNMDEKSYRLLLSRSADIGSIIADPYNSAVLWTEEDASRRRKIMSFNTKTKDISSLIGSRELRIRRSSQGQRCTCPHSLTFSPAITMNYNSRDGSTEIFFVDSVSKTIYSSDIKGCDCRIVFSPSAANKFGLPPDLMAVDHLRLSWYNTAEKKLYSISKTNGQNLVSHVVSDVFDIVAYGAHLQPLPDSACLNPGPYTYDLERTVDTTSIDLYLALPQWPSNCQMISSPVPKYTAYYRKIPSIKKGKSFENCRNDGLACSKVESYNRTVQLVDLEPFTQYLIQIAVSNHYFVYLSEQMADPVIITTACAAPTQARDVIASPFTPKKIMVKWLPPVKLNGPADQIFYIVKYSTSLSDIVISKKIQDYEMSQSWIQTFLRDLEPDQDYEIQVLSCMYNETMCNSTLPTQAHTFKTPFDMTFTGVTAHSLSFNWTSPDDGSIKKHNLEVAKMVEHPDDMNWRISDKLPLDTQPSTVYVEEILDLQPNTDYAVRLSFIYNQRPFDKAVFTWPQIFTEFTQRTLTFRPNRPSPPFVRNIKSGVYEVSWKELDDNGAPITSYILEYRDKEKNAWVLAYNGSTNGWTVDTNRLNEGHNYMFRVAAVNAHGRGPFSNGSLEFVAPYKSGNTYNVIGIIVGVLVFFGLIVFTLIWILRKRSLKIQARQFIIRGPDTELATLRELPHTTFQQSNTLYAISIQCTDEEIAKLPHFSRSQLVLHTFLGSGAFGEVFEGFAKNILGDGTGETKCAVKTLRKSASDHEKQEFLKEALLMKNFQHENILSLLGVVLDNNPQFIIMELMEGGDLLSFLRTCRATATSPPKLMLPELVKVCVHVARGCKYLEDMHFVHRDLAARNCLVSSKSPADMVVKIGDFGLARDIYKNDYYRKEGEGLLPVRWMSPESLVDGFFTTQSDIWAFGVLMWEVVTLGQQPYPARNNIDVLHFIMAGGKLERPDKCADDVYNLMSMCWSFDANDRPSFAYILQELETFAEKCAQMTAEEIISLSPHATDVLTCMSHRPSLPHHHSHHHHHHPNRLRPLPDPPINMPILDPIYAQPYYSHPWDSPAPYAKPWDSPPTNLPVSDSMINPVSSEMLLMEDNDDDQLSTTGSSLYQLPNLNEGFYDVNYCQAHDYSLPRDSNAASSVDNTLNEGNNYASQMNFITHEDDYPYTVPYKGSMLSSKWVNVNDSFRVSKKPKRRRKKWGLRRIIKPGKQKPPPDCQMLNQCDSKDLNQSDSVIHKPTSEAKAVICSCTNVSNDTTNNNDNNNGSAIDSTADPETCNTLIHCHVCENQRQKISQSEFHHQSLKVTDVQSNFIERCSPDEGIWSPYLSNLRKVPLLPNKDEIEAFLKSKGHLPLCRNQDKTENGNPWLKADQSNIMWHKFGLQQRQTPPDSGFTTHPIFSSVVTVSPTHTSVELKSTSRRVRKSGRQRGGERAKACMSSMRKLDRNVGLSNIAFIDEAATYDAGEWMNEEEEEEENEAEAEIRGLFTPNCRTITGGGSVRLIQSDRTKRLNALLGTPEKQVVDLTKIKSKRTHSLDSKNSSLGSNANYQHSDFPAAAEYDHYGYLEPRGAKGGHRYLQLMNYAPELKNILDPQGQPLVTGSGSAFTPVHVTKKGYHPSNPAYSLVSREEEEDWANFNDFGVTKHQNCFSDNKDYRRHSPHKKSNALPQNEYPLYAEVCDARRHNSTDSTGRGYTDYHYHSPSASITMTKSPRKFSDQDLYSSTAPYRQWPENSSPGLEHRYASLECSNGFNNNNYSHTNNHCQLPRPPHNRSNAYHHYAKPGLAFKASINEELEKENSLQHGSKLSTSRDTWNSNPDDVFLDNDSQNDAAAQHSGDFLTFAGNPAYTAHGQRSQNQVFPEDNTDMAGCNYPRVSLV